MFLAFNNGLSVTATGLKIVDHGDGTADLLAADDFQIVNGGQTTGSIFRAWRKDKVDASLLQVPVKITEILSDGDVEEIAPRISQSANNQNKVNMADFSSNQHSEQERPLVLVVSLSGTHRQGRVRSPIEPGMHQPVARPTNRNAVSKLECREGHKRPAHHVMRLDSVFLLAVQASAAVTCLYEAAPETKKPSSGAPPSYCPFERRPATVDLAIFLPDFRHAPL